MRRRARSTLFPYTTLFRSRGESRRPLAQRTGELPTGRSDRRKLARSEEHTSELQSRSELVCRLLLEKKNDQPIENCASMSIPAVPWPRREAVALDGFCPHD